MEAKVNNVCSHLGNGITLKNGVLNIKNKGEIKNPEKLTAKFYRENKNEGGFGLGLYIVSKICETYGFKFEIYNDTDNVVVEIDMKTQS